MSQPDPSRRDFLPQSSRGSALSGGAPATGDPAVTQPSPLVDFRETLDVGVTINGTVHRLEVEARTTLLDLLRERLDLAGTKKGCNEGACGACTVLVDGARQNACLVLAAQCAGREVTTVEGLAADGVLTHVQQAFIDHDALQCGYCTPGQVVSATACIAEGHATDEASVREWMSGNLCRCSAYPQITAAVLDAAAHVGAPPREPGRNPSLER